MLPPRFRIRTLMIAVTVVALACVVERAVLVALAIWIAMLAVPSYAWATIHAQRRARIGKPVTRTERSVAFVMAVPVTLAIVFLSAIVGFILLHGSGFH